jgi:RecB family exonuclease
LTLADGRRLGLRGTVDRLDLAADGSAAVVDYKTGRARSSQELADDPLAAGTKLQLAVYALAARAALGDRPVEASYWFVGTGTQVGYAVDETVLARLETVATTLVRSIESGLFPARPGEESWTDHEHCRPCPYRSLCPPDRGHAWELVRHDPALAGYVGLSDGADVR